MKKFLLKKIILSYIILSGVFPDSSRAGVVYIESTAILDDCICEGGIPFMSVQYKGIDGVSVNVMAGDKAKSHIKTFTNVNNGDVLTLDGSKFMHGSFKTRRYFRIIGSSTSEVMFHTSCSEDILGQTKGNFTVTSFTDKKGNTCSLKIDLNGGSSTGDNPLPIIKDPDLVISEPNTENPVETVDNPTVITPSGCFASAIVKNITCFGYTDGSISLNMSGGTAPFIYSWSNGVASKDISNLSAGLYSVTITDANKIICVLKAEVIEECAMSISYISNPIKCFGDENGAIDITVTGGKAPYKFLWNNGATTEDISGLLPGTYNLTVTDANGCSIKESYTIDIVNSFTATIEKEVCNPGYLEANAEGGQGPYTYFWSNGATTKEVAGLIDGTYTVIISDSRGCSITKNATLSGNHSPLVLKYILMKPSCNNPSGGGIDLQVTGGKAPYTFIWSNGATSEDLADLTAGNYSVTVADANGCFESAEIILESPAQMEIYTTRFSRISCFGNTDGELEILVTGGTAPYSYLWSNGATTSKINNLPAGQYEVIVSDAAGCKKVSTFLIAEPLKLNAFIVNEDCNDGSVDLVVSGGTRPYTYLWSNGAITEDLTGLETGDYSVVVTDSRGCVVEAEITITEVVDPIVVKLETENPKCNGGTGSAHLSVSGGTAPYSYTWSNGAGTENISDLKAGIYSVKVTDANACFKTLTFTIQSPAAIQIQAATSSNISCFGEEDGFLNLQVEGGTLPYSFKWSNGKTSKDLSDLAAGAYKVLVTDANGCSKEASFTITQPEELEAGITANICNNPLLDLVVTGGSKPYQYSWSNGSKTEDLTSFSEGMYYVEVTDAKGCTVVAGIEVAKPEIIKLSFETQASGCKCGSNGAINLTVEGGTGPYTYLWSDGKISEDISDIAAGEYSVVVTDSKGCSQSGSVIIEESPAIAVNLKSNVKASCAGNDGSLQVEVTGGTGPYTYLWSNGGTSSSTSGLAAGNYQIKIVDAKGCSTDAAYTVGTSSGSSSPVSAKFESCIDQVICRGESAEIKVLYSGTGNWTFTYSDGIQNHTITTSENPYILKVSPDKLTTYNLASVSNSCSAQISNSMVTVGVNDCNTSAKSKSCAINCFDTKIINIKESGSCTTYTMEVSAGNNCSFALSHFSVAVPCGTVSKVTNSRGWKVEIGKTDPTTGITGFKIDDIKGFGEDGKSGNFTVTYTVCQSGDCNSSGSSCEPIVAYKAGQCVNYDIANMELRVAETGIVNAYPNPSEDGSMTISLEKISGNEISLEIKDMAGTLYYHKKVPLQEGAQTITINGLKDYPTGIYLLMITSRDKVYTQRIVLK